MNYYNEFDSKAAAWLRELIKQGHIAPGVVDERSIEDVKPGDLDGYQQCHFFAGIGGWSLALRLAGWPDDQPVWTGSCPCQPFSAAGKGAGFADERHLWPAWFHLIKQCGPAVVFGEQVASKDGLRWFDLVQADMEGASYAIGGADLCAASVGAPHIRQRLWFVADTNQQSGRQGRAIDRGRDTGGNEKSWPGLGGGELAGKLAYSRSERHDGINARLRPKAGEWRSSDILEIARCSNAGFTMVNASSEQVGLPGRTRLARVSDSWHTAELIPCIDGKARPIEPGTFPLANGVSARVVRLRGYGNAINPEVAAEFIAAYIETKQQELRIAA